jgi:hypothetical protein
MNRRFFVTGATILAGAGALKLIVNDSFAGGDETPPSLARCVYPPALIDEIQLILADLRARLNEQGLLDIPADIATFFHGIEDRYSAAFGEESEFDEELNEAAMVLDDPACYVAVAPDEGCDYFEAWKYFAMRDALARLPADDSVPFVALSDTDQYIAVRGTVAYAGMLQNIFPSLMAHLKLSETLAPLNDRLYLYSEDMGTFLTRTACSPDGAPPEFVPRGAAPLMRMA